MFESMMSCIAQELDNDHELIVRLINELSKQYFSKEVIPTRQEFMTKLQENGWLTPENTYPLFDLLEKVNRFDIVHKARQESMKQGILNNSYKPNPFSKYSF